MYVSVLDAVIAYISFLWPGRIVDRDKVNQQFNVRLRFDTGMMDKKMEMLEKWSDIVDVLTSSKSAAQKHEARQSLDDVQYFMRIGHDMHSEGDKNVAGQKAGYDSSDVTARLHSEPQG